jgi:hypothetical protein
MARSRLTQHVQQQSIRNMLLAVGGMIAIIVLLFTFGPDLLINFSLLVKKSTDGQETAKAELTYIAPPVLNTLPDATKTPTIDVSGYAGNKQEVKLYVNGKLMGKKEVNNDKQFTFSSVKLEKGKNEIKAKAVTEDNKESTYSSIATIAYIDEPPTLEIANPQDGQTISKDNRTITVKVKTVEGAKVTVNDFWAISRAEGIYSYTLTLQDGENTIRIKATDIAGNETTKEIKVKVE